MYSVCVCVYKFQCLLLLIVYTSVYDFDLCKETVLLTTNLYHFAQNANAFCRK